MKKMLIVLLAMISISAAKAQILTVPGHKVPMLKKAPVVIVNRTCGNYPGGNMQVTVEDAGAQGWQVKFQSDVVIEKVEIQRLDPAQVLNTLSLAPDSKSGAFFMDSGAYKGSNSYVLTFYSPRKPKCMWTAAIQRKVS